MLEEVSSGEISHFFKKYVFGQSCAMCDISHNLTGVKREWRDMSKTLKYDIKLLHIDEMDSMLATICQQFNTLYGGLDKKWF